MSKETKIKILNYLEIKYSALKSLGIKAGRFAGMQGHDMMSQEPELWIWAARVFQYDLDDSQARHFWRQGYYEGYDQGMCQLHGKAVLEAPGMILE